MGLHIVYIPFWHMPLIMPSRWRLRTRRPEVDARMGPEIWKRLTQLKDERRQGNCDRRQLARQHSSDFPCLLTHEWDRWRTARHHLDRASCLPFRTFHMLGMRHMMYMSIPSKLCFGRAIVLENVKILHNWTCVVCKGSSFYFCRVKVGVTISLKSIWICTNVCSLWTTNLSYFILYRPCSASPLTASPLTASPLTASPLTASPLTVFSLLSFPNKGGKTHIGMEPSRTPKLEGNDTNNILTPFLAILPTVQITKLYIHISLLIPT